MADIRDEHGRPIQLTDEFGRPVQLTDEHGVPMHLTGVATTVGSTPHGHTTIGSELCHKTTHDKEPHATMGSETHGGTHFAPVDYAKHDTGSVKKELERTSSNSSSSEDDGEGGRRKKKGLMQKIKEALHNNNNNNVNAETAHSKDTKVSSIGGRPVAGKRVEQEHEKKGFMDKIKDKLPGHH